MKATCIPTSCHPPAQGHMTIDTHQESILDMAIIAEGVHSLTGQTGRVLVLWRMKALMLRMKIPSTAHHRSTYRAPTQVDIGAITLDQSLETRACDTRRAMSRPRVRRKVITTLAVAMMTRSVEETLPTIDPMRTLQHLLQVMV